MSDTPDAPTAPPDWAAIEAQYRSTDWPVSRIAAKFGVALKTIYARVYREGWTRDMRRHVYEATKERLAQRDAKLTPPPKPPKKRAGRPRRPKAAPDADGTPPPPPPLPPPPPALTKADRLVIEAAAEANVKVVLDHREDIRRARQQVVALLAELEMATTEPDLIRQFALGAVGDNEMARAMMSTAISNLLDYHKRVGSALRLSTALEKLQAMERVAFGLDDANSTPPPLELSPTERAARVLTIIEIARRRAAEQGTATPVPLPQVVPMLTGPGPSRAPDAAADSSQQIRTASTSALNTTNGHSESNHSHHEEFSGNSRAEPTEKAMVEQNSHRKRMEFIAK